jgi:hypothetical protein
MTKSYWISYLKKNGKIEAEEIDLPKGMELSQSSIFDYLHRFDDGYSDKDVVLVLSWSEIKEGVPYDIVSTTRTISDEVILPIFNKYSDEPIANSEINKSVNQRNLISFKYGYMLAENMLELKENRPHKYDLTDMYRTNDFSNKFVELGEKAFNEEK